MVWPNLLAMPVYLGFLIWVVSYFRAHPRASAWFWAASLLTFPIWILTGTRTNGSDLIACTTVGWNLLCTTWNAAFVYAESPLYFGSSVCILLAAELYPVFKKRPELYITARIYTLATHLLLRAVVDVFPQTMDTSSWFSEHVLQAWGVVNLVVAVPFLFWFTWQLDSGRSAVSFRRGRAEAPHEEVPPVPVPV